MGDTQLEISTSAAGADGTLVEIDEEEIPATQASGEGSGEDGLQPTTEEVSTTGEGDNGKNADIDVASLHDANVLWLNVTMGSICFVLNLS